MNNYNAEYEMIETFNFNCIYMRKFIIKQSMNLLVIINDLWDFAHIIYIMEQSLLVFEFVNFGGFYGLLYFIESRLFGPQNV